MDAGLEMGNVMRKHVTSIQNHRVDQVLGENICLNNLSTCDHSLCCIARCMTGVVDRL